MRSHRRIDVPSLECDASHAFICDEGHIDVTGRHRGRDRTSSILRVRIDRELRAEQFDRTVGAIRPEACDRIPASPRAVTSAIEYSWISAYE